MVIVAESEALSINSSDGRGISITASSSYSNTAGNRIMSKTSY